MPETDILRIGLGKKNAPPLGEEIIINDEIFTFDSDKITFDSTAETFDETT